MRKWISKTARKSSRSLAEIFATVQPKHPPFYKLPYYDPDKDFIPMVFKKKRK